MAPTMSYSLDNNDSDFAAKLDNAIAKKLIRHGVDTASGLLMEVSAQWHPLAGRLMGLLLPLGE